MSLLVVLPYFAGDEHLLLKNLAWYKELDDTLDYDCLLACDKETKITAALKAAQEVFRRVDVFQYARVSHNHWPWPQNNAFMNVAWYVHGKHKGPWFWCETDSIPTRKGWLDALWAEYQRGKKPFGGHWNSETNIFNGVAIYPQNISMYSQQMMMAGLVDAKDAAGKPYQPPWDYYGSKQVRKHLHVMNGLMQHLWDFDGTPITFPTQESVSKLLRPEAALFHRVKDGSLIDRLRERTAGIAVPDVAPVVTKDTVHGITVPRVEIFIVTYWKDAEWLSYCLRSISKYCTGFSGVTVAFPQQDSAIIGPVCKQAGARRVMFKEQRDKGHLHHMAVKCMADKFCPDSDFILHTDSDCLFKEPVTPADYFVNGKPVLLMEHFDRLKPRDGKATGYLWKEPTEKALGWTVTHEFMRRHPAVHPVSLYPAVRQHIETLHGTGFVDYVLSTSAKFPYGFCEFCTLGAFARERFARNYEWIEVGKQEVPASKLVQLWSHGGFDFEHPDHKRSQRLIIEDVLT